MFTDGEKLRDTMISNPSVRENFHIVTFFSAHVCVFNHRGASEKCLLVTEVYIFNKQRLQKRKRRIMLLNLNLRKQERDRRRQICFRKMSSGLNNNNNNNKTWSHFKSCHKLHKMP